MVDVVAELDCTTCASIFQAAGSVEACFQIAGKAKAYYFMATATPVPEGSVPSGVRAKTVFERMLADNEIGPAIFEDFLRKVLPQRKYKIAPEPFIMGMKGLKGVQEGLDRLRNGVSAKKIVIVDESSSNLSERHKSGRLALIPALLHHLEF